MLSTHTPEGFRQAFLRQTNLQTGGLFPGAPTYKGARKLIAQFAPSFAPPEDALERRIKQFGDYLASFFRSSAASAPSGALPAPSAPPAPIAFASFVPPADDDDEPPTALPTTLPTNTSICHVPDSIFGYTILYHPAGDLKAEEILKQYNEAVKRLVMDIDTARERIIHVATALYNQGIIMINPRLWFEREWFPKLSAGTNFLSYGRFNVHFLENSAPYPNKVLFILCGDLSAQAGSVLPYLPAAVPPEAGRRDTTGTVDPHFAWWLLSTLRFPHDRTKEAFLDTDAVVDAWWDAFKATYGGATLVTNLESAYGSAIVTTIKANLKALIARANSFKPHTYFAMPLNPGPPLSYSQRQLFQQKYQQYKNSWNAVARKAQNALTFIAKVGAPGSKKTEIEVSVPIDPMLHGFVSSAVGMLPSFAQSGGSADNLFDESHGAIFRTMVAGAAEVLRNSGKDFSPASTEKLMKVSQIADNQFETRKDLIGGINTASQRNEDTTQLRQKLNELEGGLARTYVRMADIGRTISEIVDSVTA